MNEVIFKTPPPRPDPLGNPAVIRLDLTTEQTAQLEAAGQPCFVVLSVGSYPTAPNRWQLLALPLDMATATACCNVVLGSHKAVRIKPAPTPAPATKTAQPAFTP